MFDTVSREPIRSVRVNHTSNGYWLCTTACFVLICLHPALMRAQLSLHAAVTLAAMNSPKVKAAQGDLARANLNLSVTKDIFIPSVVTSGGAGYTTGITLTVPTIFTVTAQSLMFSFQQRQNIRAAHSEIEAAKAALEEAQDEAKEDAIITYLSFDEAQNVILALDEQDRFANDLIRIDEDRKQAGLESEIEVMKARRGAIQVKLLRLQAEDSLEATKRHLAELTGLSLESVATDSNSIPPLPAMDAIDELDLKRALYQVPGMRAAEENEKAKEQRARGDTEYTWKPLITFGAQYGRVSPINNVSEFYNLHGNYNTANIGFQIELPILDRVRTVAARESQMEAARGRVDLENIRFEQVDGLRKLQRSLPELAAKSQLADLDFEIAQGELSSTTLELKGSAGKPPLTPKEEAAAHIEERQKYLDLLDAKLQSEKAEVTFLRQTGQLAKWLDSASARDAEGAGKNAQPIPH